MLFAKQFSSATLAQLCRLLRTGLDAGLPIVRVFRQQAERGPHATRPLMDRVAERLADGDSLADALEPEKSQLPPLFIAMLAVGEESGNLGETLRELENYFDQMQKLWRMFLWQIFWPVIELFLAIPVIALFILAQGWFGLQDILGLGTGTKGALNWLALVFIVGIIVYLIYTAAKHQIRFLAPIERLTLGTPMLGGALRAVLLSRFCLGAKLALGAGISNKRALKLSFESAGSALYNQSFAHAEKGIKRGESVHEVLSRCPIFPQDFLDVVLVGEEAGSLPETLGKQAINYQEDAAIRLRLLAQCGAWVVYILVAGFLITMIFKIATGAMAPVNAILKDL